MSKWIIAAIVIITIIVIIAILANESTPSKNSGSNSHNYQPTPNPPVPTQQRQAAAKQAAVQMSSHQMNKAASEAVQIKRIVHQRNISINTGALNTAQERIIRICEHADRIRRDVEHYCNNPAYLQQLYRTGVSISNEAYKLRQEIKAMQDSLYRLSKANPSLKPLFDKVHAFYNSVFADEVELNNRNRILRLYIGNNFGPREREWNRKIEERIRAKRASA